MASDRPREAQTPGPQKITVGGRPAAVILSAEGYERLRGGTPSFVGFMRASPLPRTIA